MAFEDSLISNLLFLGVGVLFFFFIFAVAMYVYMGFAFMAMGRKAKLKTPELAWIPFVGPQLIAFQTAKMHWWPWLLWGTLLISWIPLLNLLYFAAVLVFSVYGVIWQWKMFEKMKRPGWWALLCLIPFVNLVFYGIAAWGD